MKIKLQNLIKMTMNKIGKFGLITYLLLIISCSNGQPKLETDNRNTTETTEHINSNVSVQKQEYFEGVIEYSVEYDIKNPSLSKEKLKQHYGSKVITKFSEGNFRDEYYNNEGTLLRTSILNLSKKHYYIEFHEIDTVYYSDINTTDYITTIEQLLDTNIQNNDCWVIKSISNKNDSKPESVITKYYISKNLKVNPNWYVNYVDGGYNRIYKSAPGITVKSEYFNSNFTVIKSIVSTKMKVVDISDFKIKLDKVLKKMN